MPSDHCQRRRSGSLGYSRQSAPTMNSHGVVADAGRASSSGIDERGYLCSHSRSSPLTGTARTLSPTRTVTRTSSAG